MPTKRAQFGEVFAESGFDGSVDPPWLMVPLGQFASVRLLNGGGVDADSDNLGVAQATRGLIPGRIAIFGRSVGTTIVRATRGGTEEATLEVTVKKRKIVRVAFSVVTDKNNISPDFSNRRDGVLNRDRFAEIPALLARANGILTPQTNIVFLQAKKTQAITIFQDLDPVVIQMHERAFEQRVDSSADYHVFFVRQVQSLEVGNAALNGVTKIGKNFSVIGNRGDGVTLAHEAGHSRALGAFGRNTNPQFNKLLMFCSAVRFGTKITKAEANRMNP